MFNGLKLWGNALCILVHTLISVQTALLQWSVQYIVV